MLTIVQLLLLMLGATLLLPALMLMGECLLGAIPPRRRLAADSPIGSQTGRPSVDVLIPAHNEATVLARTIRSIQTQLLPSDRLLVVADNCTDSTASLARSMGTDVIEREDDAKRAKGYAIATGLDFLQVQSRDVLIMIDADCKVAPGSITILAKQAIAQQAPVQACYEMPLHRTPESNSPENTDSKTSGSETWNAVSAFAVKVKNQVRPLGLSRLGFGCALTGSGMAFPSQLARHPNWASDNIVEDMKTSYDLMIAGHTPTYCPHAIVTADLPRLRQDAMEQRKRWEHGHLQTLVTQVPRLITQSVIQFRPSLMIAAIDLLIPPLSLFVQLWLVALATTAIATVVLAIGWWPLGLIAAAGTGLFIAIFVAWLTHGRTLLSPGNLCTIPLYVLSKFPMYVAAVFHRQQEWKRTVRESESTACT
ncbi:glycosyltransferase family 2 protein [Planctomycetes bacterium K23_9]|uniref:N-glycosyltransferase n=1 Tax=Stieleria marina TaxID=1930275 RepID=A0A517NNU9_9BACT|nr:N-glycosyltransferase [Planctomycetes bacterium K23_9]